MNSATGQIDVAQCVRDSQPCRKAILRAKSWRFVHALLLLIATTWTSASAWADCEDLFGDSFDAGALPALISGSSTLQTTDGVTHAYYYRIPTTPVPLHGHAVLIWLHGDGGSGNGYGSGFYPFTDADSAILVTPSGINQTWTHAADDLAGQPQDSQFLSDMIDTLIADGVAGERVDPNRIYLGGESRGAFMPYFLLQRPSTKMKFAAVAVNAGLLYCQAGDTDCDTDSSSPLHHGAATPILHLHGTNDTSVEPPPTATFHDPIDWNIDWRVFFPMNLWAKQNGCFGGDNSTGNDDGVLQETYVANGHTAQRYDLSAWGASCSNYQLILVTDGGHVIGNQNGRIWSFLKGYCRAGG
jgi:poly(3-hydroxybutyrate) depolymerase